MPRLLQRGLHSCHGPHPPARPEWNLPLHSSDCYLPSWRASVKSRLVSGLGGESSQLANPKTRVFPQDKDSEHWPGLGVPGRLQKNTRAWACLSSGRCPRGSASQPARVSAWPGLSPGTQAGASSRPKSRLKLNGRNIWDPSVT